MGGLSVRALCMVPPETRPRKLKSSAIVEGGCGGAAAPPTAAAAGCGEDGPQEQADHAAVSWGASASIGPAEAQPFSGQLGGGPEPQDGGRGAGGAAGRGLPESGTERESGCSLLSRALSRRLTM